ncbi:MAG: hypothetical protein VKQ33_00815, partial [Candidatus Sericytochromatia bacterium]|nr:hypothetical protein [Candidatus Sericytochromatia bacterium]
MWDRRGPMLAAVTVLVACQAAPPPAGPTVRRPPSVQAATVASPLATVPPAAASPSAGGDGVLSVGPATPVTPATPAAALPSLPPATLFGTLRAPATLLPERGAGVISNNGGTLVS